MKCRCVKCGVINSIYGAKMPKYKVGYRFKDGIDNEFEILERQWNGNIFIYAVGHISTGYINLLTEDGIDIIIGGANAKRPSKK